VLENRPPLRPLRGANHVRTLLDKRAVRVVVRVGLEVPPHRKIQDEIESEGEDQADDGSDEELLTIAFVFFQAQRTGTAIAARAQEAEAKESQEEARKR
jgi:hypothetical protein